MIALKDPLRTAGATCLPFEHPGTRAALGRVRGLADRLAGVLQRNPLIGTVLLLVLAAPQWAKAEAGNGYTVFQHSTLESLPSTYVPTPDAIAGKVAFAMARGEYRSAQIGVRAVGGDLQDVRLELESDLDARVFRPIDAETRKLLLGYDNPVPEWIHDACLDESSEIASIGAEKTSFFWLTLHAAENAAPGEHRGKIMVRARGRPVTEIDLVVTVRPFALQRARIAYAPFFYVEWMGGQALPKFAQTDEWIGAIFRDMAEHSHTSVIINGAGRIDFSKLPPPENRYFSTLLPLAKQAGLTSSDIPIVNMDQNMTPPEHEGGMTVEQKNAAMAWYESERLKRGWPELVAYGNDEPPYPNPDLRKRYESFRDVRMRLGTAMSGIAAYGLGDMHDIWIVLGGQITPEMCLEARRMGAEVWTYVCDWASPHPLNERYYAGLYVWAFELKGHTTWHHYDGSGYKLIWMREGDKRPMPLTAWETRREGVDDYRYLQMLEDCVAANPGNPVAAEAKTWAAGLRARITGDCKLFNPHRVSAGKPLALDEYDSIREKAAGYILRIGPVPADRIPPETHACLKDEAKPFRGKSVTECVAGLKDAQSSVRRAAAWALFEMGPNASPAVDALAGCLGDAEVRMPAIRALGAFGPASLPAVPELILLLNHPDGFVRLGAVYAMGATGAPPVGALAQAVQDPYSPVAQAAARMMLTLGPAGLPALPVLVKMLDGPEWETQEPALKAIAGIGPEAASATPHIVRNWNGQFPCYSYWIEPLASIGPGAAEAVPMLEKFRKDNGSDARYTVHSVDAEAFYALYRIRRAPEDLRALVSLIGGAHKPNASAAVSWVEKLGKDAAPAAPQIRELIAQGNLSDDIKKRLETVLDSMAAPAAP